MQNIKGNFSQSESSKTQLMPSSAKEDITSWKGESEETKGMKKLKDSKRKQMISILTPRKDGLTFSVWLPEVGPLFRRKTEDMIKKKW